MDRHHVTMRHHVIRPPQPKKSRLLKTSRIHSSSVTPVGSLVAGFIESDKITVCGGLITSCCGLQGNHCVFRMSSKHAIVNSNHCKWCKDQSCTPVQESDFDEARTRAYLRGMLKLTVSDSVKLSELISELIHTQTQKYLRFPFTGTPPYCTVENIRHISSLALRQLIDFDKEFIWGDNLIFNTKVERSESGSH